MAVTTGNTAYGPAHRWRRPSFAEQHTAQAAPPQPPDDPEAATVEEDEYVTLRIQRSTLLFILNQEYATMSQTNAATKSAPVAHDLRSQLGQVVTQLKNIENQMDKSSTDQATAAPADAATNATADVGVVAQAGQQAGKRNLAKTVGKYGLGTAIVGGLAVAGVYGYKLWKSTRG